VAMNGYKQALSELIGRCNRMGFITDPSLRNPELIPTDCVAGLFQSVKDCDRERVLICLADFARLLRSVDSFEFEVCDVLESAWSLCEGEQCFELIGEIVFHGLKVCKGFAGKFRVSRVFTFLELNLSVGNTVLVFARFISQSRNNNIELVQIGLIDSLLALPVSSGILYFWRKYFKTCDPKDISTLFSVISNCLSEFRKFNLNSVFSATKCLCKAILVDPSIVIHYLNQNNFFESIGKLLQESNDLSIIRASLALIVIVTSNFQLEPELLAKIFHLSAILSCSRFQSEIVIHAILSILVNFFAEGVYFPEQYPEGILNEVFGSFFVNGTYRQKMMIVKCVHNLSTFLDECTLQKVIGFEFVQEYFRFFVDSGIADDSSLLDSAIVLASIGVKNLGFDAVNVIEYLEAFEENDEKAVEKCRILLKVLKREARISSVRID
jgi:hypothetical protein